MHITAHAPTVLGVEREMLSTPLDSSIINAAVTQYWRVSVVELTASTQSDLVACVRAGDARAGDVIAAEYQSGGRGRLARTFDAPKSSALLFSIYIILLLILYTSYFYLNLKMANYMIKKLLTNLV